MNNQIEILPASGNDDRIRREVARALFNDERLFRYSMGSVPPIHIIVKNGHVTLEGVVNSQADKTQPIFAPMAFPEFSLWITICKCRNPDLAI